MKRALLITGGTVAGVAAVLSYTPAQLVSASGSISPSSGGATINSSAPATPSTQAPGEVTAPTPTRTDAGTPTATSSSTAKKTANKKPATKKSASGTQPSNSESSATTSPSATPTQTPTSAPAPTPTPAQKAPDSNVTVTGRGYNAGGFGTVSVQITVANGVVTAAKAVSYPNRDNRSEWISKQAIPWLVEQTLAAKNSANVAGVGGATYTSNAWINSLQSALTAAGL